MGCQKKIKVILVLLLVIPVSLRAGSLQPLDDMEMASVTGQNAIQLSLKLHNNVQVKDNNHVPLSFCDGDPGTYNPCRIALEFVGKETNWLVMKEYYGYLNLTDIRLEGVKLPAEETDYYDAQRFKREDGSCMIDNCSPKNLAAIQMNYPANKGSGEYLDMRTFLNVGRMSVEVNDVNASYSDPSQPFTPDDLSDFGFLQEKNPGMANAFRISDSTGPNANMQVRFDGRTLIYGF